MEAAAGPDPGEGHRGSSPGLSSPTGQLWSSGTQGRGLLDPVPRGGFGVPPGDVSSLGTLVSHVGDELRAALRSAQPSRLLPQILRTLGEAETKSGHQKDLAALELLNTLFRNFYHEVSTGHSRRLPGGQSTV